MLILQNKKYSITSIKGVRGLPDFAFVMTNALLAKTKDIYQQALDMVTHTQLFRLNPETFNDMRLSKQDFF